MEDHGKKFSSRVIKSVFVAFREGHGEARLRQVVQDAALGHDLDYFLHEDRWIDALVAYKILDVLAQASGDPQFAIMAGRRTIEPDILGRGYSIFEALRDPDVCYGTIIAKAKTYNHAGVFKYTSPARSCATIRYTSLIPEHNRNLCALRTGQFQAIPKIWKGELAEVTESQCQAMGADSCLYHVRWVEAAGGSRLYVVASGIAGAAAFWLAAHGLDASYTLVWPALGSVIGLLLRRDWTHRAAIRDRDRLLSTQGEERLDGIVTLQRRLEENEALTAELTETNRGLDAKVSERTEVLRRTTEQLAAALEEAQAAARSKNAFLGNVTHELRTPLTMVLAAVREALATDISADVRRLLDAVDRNGLELAYHVDQLLDVAAVDTNSLRCILEDVELVECARAWAEEMRPSLALKAQELRIAAGKVHAKIDVDKVRDVFIATVGNASKFSPSGTGVTVTVSDVNGSAMMEVADEGPGMSQDVVAQIFDRFYQGSNDSRGTGLGLHLARRFAELHRGTLTCTSETGKGSHFFLTLPRDPTALDPLVAERRHKPRRLEDRKNLGPILRMDELTAAQKREAKLASVFVMSSLDTLAGNTETAVSHAANTPRIMLVESHPDTRSLLASVLGRLYVVEAVNDGPAAETRARLQPPDLMVIDARLPGLTGFELCQRLAGDSVLFQVPKILMTTAGSWRENVAWLEAGAVDCVQKPFPLDELLARVSTQLRITKDLSALRERSTRLLAIGQYSVQVSHDMRSPLMAVGGNATMAMERVEGMLNLAQGPIVEELKLLLDDIVETKQAAKVSLEYCDQIMTFLRSGSGVLDKKEENVSDLVTELAKSKRAELAALDIAIVATVPEHKVKLWMDKTQMRRAISNLLNNAREALAAVKDREDKCIWLSVRTDGNAVSVRIADNGSGIPEAARKKLGQQFATFAKPGGTGLGLAMVWNVITAHNGRIIVEEAPAEGGAAFNVVIPLIADRAVGHAVQAKA